MRRSSIGFAGIARGERRRERQRCRVDGRARQHGHDRRSLSGTSSTTIPMPKQTDWTSSVNPRANFLRAFADYSRVDQSAKIAEVAAGQLSGTFRWWRRGDRTPNPALQMRSAGRWSTTVRVGGQEIRRVRALAALVVDGRCRRALLAVGRMTVRRMPALGRAGSHMSRSAVSRPVATASRRDLWSRSFWSA